MLGKTPFERAKVNQWIEFATCELNRCQKNIIYPKFGWKNFDKEAADKEEINLKDYLKVLEGELKNNKYLLGGEMTLADVIVFRYLRFFFMLHLPEGMRKNLIPNVGKWFENIMKSKEAIKAYGRTVLCKQPIKPFNGEIKRDYSEEKKDEPKVEIINGKKVMKLKGLKPKKEEGKEVKVQKEEKEEKPQEEEKKEQEQGKKGKKDKKEKKDKKGKH